MREIKFRAWLPTEQVMCEVDGFDFPNSECVIYHNMFRFGQTTVLLEDVNIMQSTGLKVSNGELYFSDVIKFEEEQGDYSLAIVEWDVKHAKVVFRVFNTTGIDDEAEDGRMEVEDWINIEHFEILGNMHENPELLI